MKAAGFMAIVGAGAVAACATTPVPVAPAQLDIGHAITPDGAVPLRGKTVAIIGFGYDQGLAAKRSAQADCAARGMDFNTAAIGRFAAPEWVFPGACT